MSETEPAAAQPEILPGLVVGELAPWFHARALSGNPRYTFDTVAGRHILLLFYGSAADPAAAAALALVAANHALFDDAHACFFGVTHDPEDEAQGRIAQRLPGIRHFLDYDRAIADKYRFAARADQPLPDQFWVLLDPMLRILGRFPIDKGDVALKMMAAISRASSPVDNAPVLIVPHVFEASLCRQLIALYKNGTPEQSGFMREVNGKTTLLHDASHKVRSDFTIEDPRLMNLLRSLVSRRLVPMIERAYQYRVTRMERYIISGYDAEQGGHFAAHRDNTTKGTAHRRFAVSINLNAEDFEGGELSFPEFGPRRYKPPTGGAVVFSCSLLHQAWPVTKGVRYVFVPFLYDEAAAQVRAENNAFLGDGTTPYTLDHDRI